MSCLNCTEMRFRVWDFSADGKMHDTGKEFSVSLDDAKKVSRTSIDTAAVVETFFQKVFQMRNNGFSIRAEDNKMQALTIYWRGDTWRLARVF